MEMGGNGADRYSREIHRCIKAQQRLMNDVPIRRGARIADVELDTVGCPRQRRVVAKELRRKLVTIKVVPSLYANLFGSQPQSFFRIANLRAEFLETRLDVTKRRRKWHI